MTSRPHTDDSGPDSRLSAWLLRINGLVGRLERIGAVMAGFALFAIMAIVFIDVVLRYLFRAPLSWSYDLISLYLVPLLFMLVLSETFRRNHHVAVDIAYLRFPEVTKRWVRLIIAILMAPFVWTIVALAAEDALQAYRAKEVISGAILWPTWIPLALVVAGFGLLLLRIILDGASLAAALVRGTPDSPGESVPRQKADHHDEDLP